MPAPLPEEIKEKAKLLTIAVGPREAARQLGINEDTVCAWSHKEGWCKEIKAVEAAIAEKNKSLGVEAGASKSVADSLLALGPKSKLLVAKVAHKAVKVMSKKKDDALVAQMQPLKLATDVLKVAHGWGSEGQTSTPLIAIQVNGVLPKDTPS